MLRVFHRSSCSLAEIKRNVNSLGLMKKTFTEYYCKVNGIAWVEGWIPVKDILNNGFVPFKIVVTNDDALKKLKDRLTNPVNPNLFLRCLPKDAIGLTGAPTSASVTALFPRPDEQNPDLAVRKQVFGINMTVIIDGLKDTNNLGSVLRACALVGVDRIITTKGTTDIWNWNVQRTSCAANYFVETHNGCDWDHVGDIVPPKATFHFLDVPGSLSYINSQKQKLPLNTYVSPYEIDWTSNHHVLVIGNEAHGLSEYAQKILRNYTMNSLRLPIISEFSSLPASSAVTAILFEAKRQMDCLRNQKKIKYNPEVRPQANN